jgi:hypothetical protein
VTYLLEADLVDDCRRAATALQVHLEVAGQHVARKSGSSKGLPDAFLYVAGWHHPLELKRPASQGISAGRFSLDQMVAAERRRAQGVETYAPRTLEQFVALVNWSRRHAAGVCPDCPVVPDVEGRRCA